jgi:hypothetical protein
MPDPGNPLGARALYLGSTLYRIHGSNEPGTIGTQLSSGCIRMRNEDVIDLYDRVKVGTSRESTHLSARPMTRAAFGARSADWPWTRSRFWAIHR